ncbi:MAG: signal peptidase I [Bacilli bacterium]|nr:signal peptidase I [Bacilli bacterium]
MNKIKEIIPYLVIIIVVVLIRTFVITPIRVDGLSMYSTLNDGDILLLEKYDKAFKRFDIVVFTNGEDRLIKRVIGLPGDKIEYKNNKLYINGKYKKEKFLTNNQKTFDFSLEDIGYKKIPKDYYFVLGDNRTNSTDSRILGLIKKEKIQGKANFTVLPLSKFGRID